MNLAAPEWITALWALVPAAALALFAVFHARAALRRFIEAGLIPRMAPGASAVRAITKRALPLLALALIMLALARPQWGETDQPLTRAGRDVCFIIDVSRSMLAEDILPSRLERAKIWVRDVLDAARGDRVAIIAFAGVPSVKCPLTLDYGFARTALDDLSPDSVPRGGTMIGDAVRTALSEVFKGDEARFRDIILITDGEDHGSFPVEAARAAAEAGVRIIAVGIGDEGRGTPIRYRDDSGRTRTITHEGQTVLSRMDAQTLRDMAAASRDGVYYPVGLGNIELDRVYQDLVRTAEQREITGDAGRRLEDRFQWFIAAAMLILLIDALIRERGRAQPA